MEIVNCNNCFIPFAKTIKFFLTNCRHIFCSTCCSDGDLCKVCKANFRKTEIGKNLPDNLKFLFQNITEMGQDYEKARIFQTIHALHYIKHNIGVTEELAAAQRLNAKLKKQDEALKKKIAAEKCLIDKLLKFQNPGTPVANDTHTFYNGTYSRLIDETISSVSSSKNTSGYKSWDADKMNLYRS